MILLHRVSSFVVALLAAGGFSLLIAQLLHPVLAMALTVIACGLVLSRLLGWHVRTFQFWHLLLTPLLFLASTFGIQFLLETFQAQTILAAICVFLLFLFVEQLFSFMHLPVQYQPFTLEYLSQLLHILSVFFLATLGFGLRLFIQAPLWLLSLVLLPMFCFIVYGTLWAGKVDAPRARPYALASGVLLTELFAAISLLPTGFYTNAAFLALSVYVLLGLSRADAMRKLSKDVLRRYVILFVVLTILIASTSQWI